MRGKLLAQVTMQLFEDMAQLTREGRPFVVATVISTKGSTPQKPGSRVLVLDDGQLRGTVGGGAIEKQVVDAAVALLREAAESTRIIETHLTHDLGMCCGGQMTVFLERVGGHERLVVFGAGHVAKELAALAAGVGFDVTVVDERSELATAARFPKATLSLRHPADAARAELGGAHTYYCVVTHDHPLDQACVEALLSKPSAYLGVIGSQRKAARFRARLEAQGVDAAALARLECPMGVPIAALTPQEIAVSIVARLVAVRRSQVPATSVVKAGAP